MTKPDAYDRVIEKLHLSFNPGSPDDPPYPEPEFFLRDCSRDRCPWCKVGVKQSSKYPVFTDHDRPRPANFCNWDEDSTIDENRIRYAAERLEDAQVRQP